MSKETLRRGLDLFDQIHTAVLNTLRNRTLSQAAFGFLEYPVTSSIQDQPNAPRRLEAKRGDKEVTPRRRVARRSDPHLTAIWRNLVQRYFPQCGHLHDYELYWSPRQQRRVLASCCPARKRINVAKELNDPRWHEFLEPLLYHELCHAVIGENGSSTSGKWRWHGRQFRELESRHPDIQKLNAWIEGGGWNRAVRSSRAKVAWAKRRSR